MRLTPPTAAIAVILTGLNIAAISYSGEEAEADVRPLEKERLALQLSLEKLHLQLDKSGANGEDRRKAVAAWHASKAGELDALANRRGVEAAIPVPMAGLGEPPVPSGKSAEEFLSEAARFKSDVARQVWAQSMTSEGSEGARLALANHVHSGKMVFLEKQIDEAAKKVAETASVPSAGGNLEDKREVSEEVSDVVADARLQSIASEEDPRFRIARLQAWVDGKLREDEPRVPQSPVDRRERLIKQLETRLAPR